LLIDFVATEENVSLVEAPGFVKAPGGAPANVAVGLQRLGLSSAFVGKVGDDPFGQFLRQTLEVTGVDTSYLFIDPVARTTIVFVAVRDDGRKDLCFFRNPGADMRLTPEEITETIFDNARCFHYGSISFIDEPSAGAQRKALDIAHRRGLMISYDPNYRPTLWPSEERARAVIQDGFRHCHLAKIADEEWEIATGERDLDAGLQAVLNRGVELVVVSRGASGALVTNGDYCIELPALDVEVAETIGAGDGFMAAMISRLLPERERLGSLSAIDRTVMEEALDFGISVGALTCTKVGAIPALPTLAEVEGFRRAIR
jgi:fructokinase